MSKQYANSGGVVIQKQHSAIADIHAPVAATPPSLLPQVLNDELDIDPELEPRRNQILLVGRRREARRSISPGPRHHLQRIESAAVARYSPTKSVRFSAINELQEVGTGDFYYNKCASGIMLFTPSVQREFIVTYD
jgi:hypothetical protein